MFCFYPGAHHWPAVGDHPMIDDHSQNVDDAASIKLDMKIQTQKRWNIWRAPPRYELYK